MMEKKLYEVYAKGERIPEQSPNSTCKTWRLITCLYLATSAREAEFLFESTHMGEYEELLPGTKEVPESSPIYQQYMELQKIFAGGDTDVSGTE